MTVCREKISVPKRALLLSSVVLIFLLAILFNIVLISNQKLPELVSEGNRLTSMVTNSEIFMNLEFDMYDRVNESAVLETFLLICNDFYNGKNFINTNGMFRYEQLKSAGFEMIGTVNKHDLLSKYSEIVLEKASKSLWYNPIIFNETIYRKTARYPLVTDPVFKRKYPFLILFIKNNENDTIISAEICGRYIVIAPINFFKELIGEDKNGI